jgi:hypothetical protein
MEMNTALQQFAELCEQSDAIESGKESLDPQVSIEAAETVIDFLGAYIAVCALRGARPTPAHTLAETDLYS